MEPTLRTLREQSGLSIGTVKERLEGLDPTLKFRQRSAIINLENRGTRDIDLIRALATIYGKTVEEVDAAALESRRQFQKEQKGRGFSVRRIVTESVILS